MQKFTTINYKGVEFDIDYWYQPAEKAETGSESKYPGCAESIEEINEIKHKDTCFMEFFEDEMDKIKIAIFNEKNEI